MLTASYNKLVLPALAFLFFGSVTLVLWGNQNNHEQELVLRHTETSAEQLRIRIKGFMDARIASLELLADRWVERQPPDYSYQRFLGFAGALYRRYSGYSQICWVDPQGVIQWVFPREHRTVVGGKSILSYADPHGASILADMKKGTDVVLLPCVLLNKESLGFHMLRPLVSDNNLQGYLDGVFEVQQIMAVCLTRDLLSDFSMTMQEEGRTIYQHGYAGDLNEAAKAESKEKINLRAVREVKFGGKTWTLRLEPSVSSYARRSLKNLPLLFFGLTLSAVLSLLLYFLIQRMEMFKSSCEQALYEVSERERVQVELRENEEKLEGLLAELTTKNAELEAFVYTVSHDLKTPIVTIDGFIGALREDFGENLSEVGERYLQYMSEAARKMETLINDLFNLSRVGRITEEKTRFSLGSPVEEAIAVLGPQIDARGIAVNVQEDLPTVYAERKRIGQIVDNLLANAVKYIGKDNPAPRIDVGCEIQNGEKVFYVRDNGIGIEERYFHKIFQIFERLPSAKLAGGGTGIGLTIVKRIVEHHGGRIWLTSEPGRGSTFYFTLEDKIDS